MNRRLFFKTGLMSLVSAACGNGSKLSPHRLKVAFGSCARPWLDQAIWDTIQNEHPDLFVFLGDCVYTDYEYEKDRGVIEALKQAYKQMEARPDFSRFRKKVPIIGTWDDHDYGLRDGGENFERKTEAKELFLNFMRVGQSDPRRQREGGIYSSQVYNAAAKQTRIILLDTRFDRSNWSVASEKKIEELKAATMGPYLVSQSGSMLSEEQWAWLEQEIAKPADLLILGSGIQFAASHRGWESWSNFPSEKKRLYELLKNTSHCPSLFISGDVHYGEVSMENLPGFKPITDITSSGLSHFWPVPGPNSNRIGEAFNGMNYGALTIDWSSGQPIVTAEIKDNQGNCKIRHKVSF